MTAHRPQVIAHRGASAREPEHTLAAYTEAIKVGSDGLVSTLELTQLQGLDWGSWKARDDSADEADDEEPDVVTDDDRSHLLTLKRLLGLVADTDRHVEVAIETKHPTRYAGLVERRLTELLATFGWAGPGSPVRVMSFSLLAVRRMRQLAPDVPRVFLMERVPLPYRDGSLPPGVAIAGVSMDVLHRHPAYVQRVHDRGHRLHVYTVDEPADVDLCVRLGVDALITNRPADVLQHLGR